MGETNEIETKQTVAKGTPKKSSGVTAASVGPGGFLVTKNPPGWPENDGPFTCCTCECSLLRRCYVQCFTHLQAPIMGSSVIKTAKRGDVQVIYLICDTNQAFRATHALHSVDTDSVSIV